MATLATSPGIIRLGKLSHVIDSIVESVPTASTSAVPITDSMSAGCPRRKFSDAQLRCQRLDRTLEMLETIKGARADTVGSQFQRRGAALIKYMNAMRRVRNNMKSKVSPHAQKQLDAANDKATKQCDVINPELLCVRNVTKKMTKI